MATGKPPTYEPLRAYLDAQTGDTVMLTLPAFETILGTPLPVSARTPGWWANRWQEGHARAWLDAGRRVTGRNVRIAAPTVTFTRADSAP